jgi:hypothetical protein
MEILTKYSVALWADYHRTKDILDHRRLTRRDKIRLSKCLYETKRLCTLTDRQRVMWQRGFETGWPIDPSRQRQPEKPLVFTLDDYAYAAPEIKRFMDRSGAEFERVMATNPPLKRWWHLWG